MFCERAKFGHISETAWLRYVNELSESIESVIVEHLLCIDVFFFVRSINSNICRHHKKNLGHQFLTEKTTDAYKLSELIKDSDTLHLRYLIHKKYTTHF